MSCLIKIHHTLLLLLFFNEISVGQVIIDSCFMSASPGTSFSSSSNMAGQDADLLSWTGSSWTGGWPGANLTIPPPNNGVACRAVFMGNASSWTTGGEGFGLRFTPALVTGQTYTFNITYVSHGTGSNGSFSPRFFTNSNGSITGAYLVGNLVPVGYAWTTNPVTFTATAAQSGHTWIYMHSGPNGSSGLVNNFCPSCNISCNPAFNPVGPYCSGAIIPALPTTSINGVPGTWSPAINNNATTTYTFTPSNGCATTTTLTITINPNVTPSFNSLGPYCVGATPGTLPTTSTNGITGTWSPATINTATAGTSTYTFTPTTGQCATTKTMSVTVNPNITPAFTTLGPYCTGAIPGTLPTTSTNGITGTWNPATISTATAGTSTYTFTPTAGQCATTTTMSVTVNPNITPAFTALGPYCTGATPGTLPTTSTNGITGTWNPATISTATTGTSTYTFTPTAGQCANTTTMSVTVATNITPTFMALGPYCVGATPGTLPMTSTNSISGTWSPATISTATAGTSTYTFTPTAGQCATTTTMSVTVNPNITPTFTALGPYCAGATPGTLPTASTNSITGTWSPATISTATAGTGTYTFTPTAGQCATNTTMTVTVNPNITPAFAALGPYCIGATPGVLPATSTNSITGTWNPATISTATAGTSTYTFTPTAGQCATTTTMSVTVNPNITPSFTALGPYCAGATTGTLPTTSTNSINGTWSPTTISTATAGTSTYTFTPTAGQCATNTTMTVTVTTNVTPAFTTLGPYCVGATPGTLPTTSTNSINGTWSPTTISTATAGTSTYTFTPTAGQCATTTTMSVTVDPNITPLFTGLGPYCAGATPGVLPATSTNNIAGTWNPATINTASAGTTTYTFTPAAGQCAVSANIEILVNAIPVIYASASHTNICFGHSAEIYAAGAANYVWQPGNMSGNFLTVAPNTTTTYSVTGDVNGCSASGSVTVNVYPYPVISFSADKMEGCEDLPVQFTDLSNFSDATWYWEFSDNTFSYQQNPMHYFNDQGTYDVTLTMTTIYGCTSSFTWQDMITVYKMPDAEFVNVPESPSELEPTVWFFDRSAGASAWEWNFGDYLSLTNNSNEQNATHLYSDTGVFTVMLVAITDYGCRDTAWHTVYIKPDVAIYVPNAFTPNDDPANPNFICKGEGIDWSTFEMRIYDRWGKQLLYTNDHQKGWNGEFNGVEMPQDVYTWLISFTDIRLKKHNLKGIVTLIK